MDKNPHIFVSHSHQDDAFCLRLISDLRANLGEDAVWYDTSGGLHGGDDWWDRIIAEITERPYFLVVLSPNASESKWVPQEMKIAFRQSVELGKHLLPIRLAPAPRRPDWESVQEFDFTQADDPAHYAASLAEVLRAIGADPNAPTVTASSTAPDPNRPLSPNERLAQEIHTAYAREHWSDVLDKTEILVERGAMTPVLWRERASAAFAIGDNNGGLGVIKQALKAGIDDADTLLLYVRLTARAGNDEQTVEILTRAYALAALDDTTTRLAILDELTAALAHLKRWDDFARRVSDARRMAPNDVRWVLREIQRLLETGQFDEAIAAAHALPAGTDVTPLLSSWHVGIAAAVSKVTSADDKYWHTFRALLDAAASAGVDPSIIARWRFEFPHFVPRVILSGQDGVSSMVWSPNGARLAASSTDGVRVWDAASGRLLGTLPELGIMAWAPDGMRIASTGARDSYTTGGMTISTDATISIWDTTSGRLLTKLAPSSASTMMRRLVGMFTRSVGPIQLHGMAWSPNGQWLAALGNDNNNFVQIWDTSSGHLLTTLPVPGYANVMEWSPDGALLATSGSTRGFESSASWAAWASYDVQVWEAASGPSVNHSFRRQYVYVMVA